MQMMNAILSSFFVFFMVSRQKPFFECISGSKKKQSVESIIKEALQIHVISEPKVFFLLITQFPSLPWGCYHHLLPPSYGQRGKEKEKEKGSKRMTNTIINFQSLNVFMAILAVPCFMPTAEGLVSARQRNSRGHHLSVSIFIPPSFFAGFP